MNLTSESLREMFVAPGHVTEEDFVLAEKTSQEKKTSIEEQLVLLGLVNDFNLGKTIADTHDYKFCDLSTITIEDVFLEILPEIVAREQKAIVHKIDETTVYVATLNPDNYSFQKLFEKKLGKNVVFSYTTHAFLSRALESYKGDYNSRILSLIDQFNGGESEGVIVSMVDLLLEYGNQSKASDIHIEPLQTEVRVRFRIDGVLHDVAHYPKSLHEQLSFRIKILSQLQTDEHGKTQDGRFSYSQEGETFDIRVSIIPITDGENIVMRLLSATARQYTLNTLGLSSEHHEIIMNSLRQPHGMILSVGPTGSGKTTVLYTLLEQLNRPEVNIMTIEDPVEYDIASVQQTQVNPSKGLVFSSGLRAVVRQDPDIIMVGEIRDEETADIAVNAALTGHLLLSTLHSNDAATTFPRLAEMGVEPFLVASSIHLIVSLRLVRTICQYCKGSYFLSDDEQQRIIGQPKIHTFLKEISGESDISKIRFYKGAGCKTCHNSGFIGRIAIFEILEMTDALRLLVSKNATADEINSLALELGMKPLLYDGVSKALQGNTTIMEVINVAYSS